MYEALLIVGALAVAYELVTCESPSAAVSDTDNALPERDRSEPARSITIDGESGDEMLQDLAAQGLIMGSGALGREIAEAGGGGLEAAGAGAGAGLAAAALVPGIGWGTGLVIGAGLALKEWGDVQAAEIAAFRECRFMLEPSEYHEWRRLKKASRRLPGSLDVDLHNRLHRLEVKLTEKYREEPARLEFMERAEAWVDVGADTLCPPGVTWIQARGYTKGEAVEGNIADVEVNTLVDPDWTSLIRRW